MPFCRFSRRLGIELEPDCRGLQSVGLAPKLALFGVPESGIPVIREGERRRSNLNSQLGLRHARVAGHFPPDFAVYRSSEQTRPERLLAQTRRKGEDQSPHRDHTSESRQKRCLHQPFLKSPRQIVLLARSKSSKNARSMSPNERALPQLINAVNQPAD